MNDQQALLIGIKCERGSHNFFKRYGERFEDSEGKRIFLEFADEEREHLDLLIREYRALARAPGRRPPSCRSRVPPRSRALIDLHTHTTASDGRCTPAELVARATAGRCPACSASPITTRSRGCAPAAAACAAAGIEFVPGIEITAVRDDIDVHTLGYFMDRRARRRLRPS